MDKHHSTRPLTLLELRLILKPKRKKKNKDLISTTAHRKLILSIIISNSARFVVNNGQEPKSYVLH